VVATINNNSNREFYFEFDTFNLDNNPLYDIYYQFNDLRYTPNASFQSIVTDNGNTFTISLSGTLQTL